MAMDCRIQVGFFSSRRFWIEEWIPSDLKNYTFLTSPKNCKKLKKTGVFIPEKNKNACQKRYAFSPVDSPHSVPIRDKRAQIF